MRGELLLKLVTLEPLKYSLKLGLMGTYRHLLTCRIYPVSQASVSWLFTNRRSPLSAAPNAHLANYSRLLNHQNVMTPDAKCQTPERRTLERHNTRTPKVSLCDSSVLSCLVLTGPGFFFWALHATYGISSTGVD